MNLDFVIAKKFRKRVGGMRTKSGL